MFFSAGFSSSTPHTKGRSGKCHPRQWPLPTPPEISAWLICFCDDQKSVFSYRPFFRTREVSMRYMYLKLHPGECPHQIPKLFAVLSAGRCVSAAQRGPHVVCLQCGPVALASTRGHFGGVQLRVASLWITFSMCPFVLGAQRSVRARGCGPGSKAKCTSASCGPAGAVDAFSSQAFEFLPIEHNCISPVMAEVEHLFIYLRTCLNFLVSLSIQVF